MKRSNSTSGLAKALVLAALFGAVGCSQGESRPNVILVVVDTLRADHTSLGTYQRDTTPEISEYFAGGTVFESASTTSSWTLPSMAMTFTGAYRLANEGDLGEDEKTLSVAFQAAGYQTGAVVANPLLGPYKRTNPQTKVRTVVDPGFGQGFDFFDVTPPLEKSSRAQLVCSGARQSRNFVGGQQGYRGPTILPVAAFL